MYYAVSLVRDLTICVTIWAIFFKSSIIPIDVHFFLGGGGGWSCSIFWGGGCKLMHQLVNYHHATGVVFVPGSFAMSFLHPYTMEPALAITIPEEDGFSPYLHN